MSDTTKAPLVVMLGGPNGAGKSTVAPVVLQQTLRVMEFVNADVIARGLSAFDPDRAALQAGRVMLHRLDELEAVRADFAFETTMASRSFEKRLKRLKTAGYDVRVYFVWVASPMLSIKRVADRVRAGGHFVPPDVVTRRYERGIANFVHLYLPLATHWSVYDNSQPGATRIVATGKLGESPTIHVMEIWNEINEVARRQQGGTERSDD